MEQNKLQPLACTDMRVLLQDLESVTPCPFTVRSTTLIVTDNNKVEYILMDKYEIGS